MQTQTPMYMCCPCVLSGLILSIDLSCSVICANSPIAGSSLIPRLQSSFKDTVTRDVQELCSSFDHGLSGELEEDGEEDDPMEGRTGDAEDVVIKINGVHGFAVLNVTMLTSCQPRVQTLAEMHQGHGYV
jgi:hypothetical protein